MGVVDLLTFTHSSPYVCPSALAPGVVNYGRHNTKHTHTFLHPMGVLRCFSDIVHIPLPPPPQNTHTHTHTQLFSSFVEPLSVSFLLLYSYRHSYWANYKLCCFHFCGLQHYFNTYEKIPILPLKFHLMKTTSWDEPMQIEWSILP